MGLKSGIKIIGTGSYVPSLTVKNEDFVSFIETSDEWISSRTGIRERRINPDGSNAMMGIEAAKSALLDARCAAEEIDYVLVSTSTPDFYYPGVSCLIAAEIGAVNAGCADVSAACTGFIEALDFARAKLAVGDCQKILVVASEKLSSHVDFTDRSTCVLFGDGAAAVVVEAADSLYAAHISAQAEKIDEANLFCRVNYEVNAPFREKLDETTRHSLKFYDAIAGKEKRHTIYMDGTNVYKFAVDAMPKAVRAACEKAKLDIADIDLFIPHQANIRIINTAVKALGLPKEKVYTNIAYRGNTSSACIPTCLDELKREGVLKRGMKLCFVAFGAGLVYGAICFTY